MKSISSIQRNQPQRDFENNNNNDENEDGWIDVEEINDMEIVASTNQILRENTERSYQQWKFTVRGLVLFRLVLFCAVLYVKYICSFTKCACFVCICPDH